MSGVLNDSVTVGILLAMIFGAVTFYLYSRMMQNEKRVSLLENLLLTLKMSTEASLMGADMLGPESVEPLSHASPLKEEDMDTMDEEKYSEMLKEMPFHDKKPQDKQERQTQERQERQEPRKMDANLEAMSLKELQALGRQKGLSVHSVKKKDLIDSLKELETPGEPLAGDTGGFSVNLAEIVPETTDA
jgi:hypothetical protein